MAIPIAYNSASADDKACVAWVLLEVASVTPHKAKLAPLVDLRVLAQPAQSESAKA